MNFFIGIASTLSLLALSGCLLLNTAAGLGLLFRRSRKKRSDFCFSALCFTLAFTSLHHILILKGVYEKQPQYLFAPIYFTLSFGMLLFYAIKLNLFPSYRFVGTDAKHLILPLGQFLYFLWIFLFTSVVFRQELGRVFYSPFYGGLEMALYIATFYAYLFGAYRYIHFKTVSMRHADMEDRDLHDAFWLRRLVRILIILFWINSAYIIIDFVMYELLSLNMHNFRGFTRFGDLSFAAMAGWVGFMGLVLLTNRPYKSLSDEIFRLVKSKIR